MENNELNARNTKQWLNFFFSVILIIAILGAFALIINYQKYESPHQKRMNLIEEKSAIFVLKQRMNIDSIYNDIRYSLDSVLIEIEKEEQELKSQK